MQFSRAHAGMLALVAIFTGIIAPIASNMTESLPLPLTNIQWVSYIMCLILILLFYRMSIGNWGKVALLSYTLLGLIIFVFGYILLGNLSSIKTELVVSQFSWGWIFLASGSIMLLFTLLGNFDSEMSNPSFSDKLIGLLGSGTLLLFSCGIFFISFSWPEGYQSKNILSHHFGSGQKITYLSGITLSPPFEYISGLHFERKKDLLRFEGKMPNDTIYQRDNTWNFGNTVITVHASGGYTKNGVYQSGQILSDHPNDTSIIALEEGSISLISSVETKTFTGVHTPTFITKDQSAKTLAWAEGRENSYIVKKNGEVILQNLDSIHAIHLSPSGYDIMVKGVYSGTTVIYKNNELIHEVKDTYVVGTYRSNGSHFIYVVKEEGDLYRLIYDGSYIIGKFEEIREIFLEKSGNSYTYFARPIGESKYCLYTRYRGNLCNLSGYMNPTLSADGGSILFAGFVDGIWSIFRNTGVIVKNTQYSSKDIRYDYVFFDITNPRQFVFITKGADGKYRLIKNGELIRESWDDVGLDVQFGYDSKVIMSTKKGSYWYIIEL